MRDNRGGTETSLLHPLMQDKEGFPYSGRHQHAHTHIADLRNTSCAVSTRSSCAKRKKGSSDGPVT